MFNFKCFLKDHKLSWNRNIFGDEINGRNGKRTEFRCDRCGHYEYIHDFVVPTKRSELLEDIESPVMELSRKSRERKQLISLAWSLIFAMLAGLWIFVIYWLSINS